MSDADWKRLEPLLPVQPGPRSKRGDRRSTSAACKALEQAKKAAKGKDVRVGGGAGTVRQYLQAQLVDEMHLGQAPVLLGSGESLFEGLDLDRLGYQVVERVSGEGATHLIVRKR